MRREDDIRGVRRENEGNKVGDLVSKTFEELGKNSRKQRRIAYIQYIWEQVAPAKVLDHTDNVFLFFKDGKRCFVVYVDDPVWSAELMAQKDRFRLFMEQALQEGPIDEIRFQTSSAAYRRKNFRKHDAQEGHHVRKPVLVPLTREEICHIERYTEDLDDDGLRDAIRDAWKQNLSRRKGDAMNHSEPI
ncbi:MAG: DciA family protein [Actinomycetota bacterium]|nr:DciA family protein [Actinomycetota bacterium]